MARLPRNRSRSIASRHPGRPYGPSGTPARGTSERAVGDSVRAAGLTPLDVAAKVLARGPRTEAELAARLERLGYSTAKVAATVTRCRELRYVDDAAVAMDRARALRTRGAGSLRIATELLARGVPDVLAASAVQESLAGEREAEWARRALARARINVEDPRVRSRAWRLLASRGFPEDVVADVVPDVD